MSLCWNLVGHATLSFAWPLFMETAILIRTESGDHGTFGRFLFPAIGYESYTAEPPWKNNQRSVSCVPAGEYIVQERMSPKYGSVYHVTDVEGRSWILHHSGNYAGDTTKGLKSHTMGCILHGQKLGFLGGQKAVLNSRFTMADLHFKSKMQTFKLIIRWLY